MTTEEIRFIDELPERGPRQLTAERAAVVMAHPGKWAIWPKKVVAAALQKQLDKVKEGFECVSIKGTIYVRYSPVDEEDTHEEVLDQEAEAETKFTRPRARCPSCKEYFNVPPSQDRWDVLFEHGTKSPRCMPAIRALKAGR